MLALDMVPHFAMPVSLMNSLCASNRDGSLVVLDGGLTVVSVCLMWAGLWRPEVTGVDKVSLCDLPNYNYTYRYETLHLTTIRCRYFRWA
jgi:hypothetical protein